MTTIALLRRPVTGLRAFKDWLLERITGYDAEDRAMMRDPDLLREIEEARAEIAAGLGVTGEELKKRGLGG